MAMPPGPLRVAVMMASSLLPDCVQEQITRRKNNNRKKNLLLCILKDLGVKVIKS